MDVRTADTERIVKIEEAKMSMNRLAPYSLAVSLIALAASAVALLSVLASPPAPAPESLARDATVSDAALPARLQDLLARMEELGEENRDLRDRLARLEVRPDSKPPAPDAEGLASQEELEALRDQLVELQMNSDALMTATGIPGEPETLRERFKASVADTLAEIRKEEAIRKVRAGHEERLAALDETMPRIEEWLDLTPYQSGEMRSALLAQHDRDTQLIEMWEQGVDETLLGEQKARNRDRFHNDLALFLSAEQLETAWPRLSAGAK
jgi:hypothetical protein